MTYTSWKCINVIKNVLNRALCTNYIAYRLCGLFLRSHLILSLVVSALLPLYFFLLIPHAVVRGDCDFVPYRDKETGNRARQYNWYIGLCLKVFVSISIHCQLIYVVFHVGDLVLYVKQCQLIIFIMFWGSWTSTAFTPRMATTGEQAGQQNCPIGHYLIPFLLILLHLYYSC